MTLFASFPYNPPIMRVLLISSSARGHAIADALSRSPRKPEIISICPKRNPGIAALASEQHVGNIMDFHGILEIARKSSPDFAFIGPDDPIGAGLADALEDIGIPSVAPKASLARIESSKGFARDLMNAHGLDDASPLFRVFTSADADAIRRFMEEELRGNFVVKYDGLLGGKGVKVSGEHLASVEDGVAYALSCIEQGGRVVLEEKLVGVEFSLLAFVSGDRVVNMPAVQDHKRAYEGDTGPNTGGMGTYSDADHSLPFLTPFELDSAAELNRAVAEALMKECGEPFKGILYGGFMATKNGVKVIEFNARFGDPEALNVLPLLESDFVDVCQGIIGGELDESMVTFAKKATVCKYVTPKGYPETKDQQGESVLFPKDIPENARIFYGDVNEESGALTLGTSRTAGIVGIGATIQEAQEIAENLCQQVEGPIRFRSDIGTEDLIRKRIDLMTSLRT